MLVKIEDGFYLNSQHIIAVHVSKNPENGLLAFHSAGRRIQKSISKPA